MRRSVDRKKTLPDPDSLKGVTPTKIINLFCGGCGPGSSAPNRVPCSPLRADIGPASEVCAECVALGDSWPALDVPAVWLRRLLRQVKKQARPRTFPPDWPSTLALQRAGYGLSVVLRGRGASRPEMTESSLPGLTSDRHELVYWRGGRLDASHGHCRFHWHLVLSSHRHRRCSCVGPNRSSANCTDSIEPGRSRLNNRSCRTFWTSRDAAIYHRRLRAQSSRTAGLRLT